MHKKFRIYWLTYSSTNEQFLSIICHHYRSLFVSKTGLDNIIDYFSVIRYFLKSNVIHITVGLL